MIVRTAGAGLSTVRWGVSVDQVMGGLMTRSVAFAVRCVLISLIAYRSMRETSRNSPLDTAAVSGSEIAEVLTTSGCEAFRCGC